MFEIIVAIGAGLCGIGAMVMTILAIIESRKVCRCK